MSKQPAEYIDAFRKFDKNGDGFITKAELAEAMTKLVGNVSDAELQAWIKNNDADKDGRINYKEFLSFIKGVKPGPGETAAWSPAATKRLPAAKLVEYRAAFARFDKSHNGGIAGTEIGDVLKALNRNPSDPRVKDVVNKLDADKNGILNFDEFVGLMETLPKLQNGEYAK
ncbi:hypothetical protein GGI00_002278 [Coemansia sp. RSA 2681]|nr:hypothetical protein GGI00_002278 [Coemansia sp. RSA 2681]